MTALRQVMRNGLYRHQPHFSLMGIPTRVRYQSTPASNGALRVSPSCTCSTEMTLLREEATGVHRTHLAVPLGYLARADIWPNSLKHAQVI